MFFEIIDNNKIKEYNMYLTLSKQLEYVALSIILNVIVYFVLFAILTAYLGGF